MWEKNKGICLGRGATNSFSLRIFPFLFYSGSASLFSSYIVFALLIDEDFRFVSVLTNPSPNAASTFSDHLVVDYLKEPEFLPCSASFICLPSIGYFSNPDIPPLSVFCLPHYSSLRGFSIHYLKKQLQIIVFPLSTFPKYQLSLRLLKASNLKILLWKNG